MESSRVTQSRKESKFARTFDLCSTNHVFHPASNAREILVNLPEADVESIETTNIMKTLGARWNPSTDEFSFEFTLPEKLPETKANILSEIASLHDPLGIIGPVILKAKLHMMPLRQVKWTEKIPNEVLENWIDFRSQLHLLQNVKVKRLAIISNPIEIQMHGFSDAAEPGYGAAIYLRSTDAAGNVVIFLLCGKSRVSPPK